MLQFLTRTRTRASRFLTENSVSQKSLARACTALFALSLVPLVVIALYNYPADDDFAFSLPAATAWVQTGSLGEVVRAIAQKTREIYDAWQGNFVSTFFFGVIPLIFDIKLYFLSNWFTLALLCLSAGYLLKGVTEGLLHAGRSAFLICYFAVMVLTLQFMPSIGYSVYWHNGGMYTVAACTLMQALGLALRLRLPQSRARLLWRGAMLCLCCFMLGGSFYGPALGAFVLLALLTAQGWVQKRPGRLAETVALAFFVLSFAISVAAPGVALRQERTGETAGALFSVVTAVMDSFDLAGRWLSPQLLAMLALALPVLWNPLRQSGYAFRHPLLVFFALYGLFSASLVPGIYTGFGYQTERYLNALYLYFLVMAFGSLIYAEGALIRFWERRSAAGSAGATHALAATAGLGKRFLALYLALVLALLAFGGFGFTIMNTSSISAAKSLLTGEAARFRQEMAERQEYIRVTDSDVVSVQPLSGQPYVFKSDRLPFQGIYGRVRYMKWYFELFADEGKP